MDKSTKLLLPLYLTFLCNGIAFYGATGCLVTVLGSLEPPIDGLLPQAVLFAASILGPLSAVAFVEVLGLRLTIGKHGIANPPI